MLIDVLSAFLLGAVICDLASHRLPNYYLLGGLLIGLALQVWLLGWFGLGLGGKGVLAGFALFIPFYALGGMAAGDVKLMAAIGGFLDAESALWAAACSLMIGGVLGIVYLIVKGDLGKLLVRYWAMVLTRSRIPAAEGEAALHRFPYAVAIAAGTLLSLYWTPI
jgi:prepilin peptidase CpaA